ncbi:unnamed protein product [Cuscuta campestris]|uniref:Leucine-rich repeat-containing N-terminal plant-type domain-containing protein n=1 Tax=Cuscuta campestris TaxID=132261 RepID=A0A484NGS6_9ASTE|nr:unnamed protein product [Cuscuta campestris]
MKISYGNYVAFFFLMSFFALETAAASARTEAEALVKWKNTLFISSSSSSSSSSLSSWSLPGLKNLCKWSGIVCNNRTTVSQINLANGGLSGTLDHLNFTSFASLAHFNISGNNFTGSVPPTIGDARSLVSVDLSSNMFGGTIPPQIGNLTELQHLTLFNNNIAGAVPYQIGNLQKV